MSKLIARLGTLACLGIVSVATAANDDAARRFHTLSTQEWTWRQAQFAGADDEDTQALPADHLPRDAHERVGGRVPVRPTVLLVQAGPDVEHDRGDHLDRVALDS